MHSFGNWVVIKLTIHEKLQRCWCMSALWHFLLLLHISSQSSDAAQLHNTALPCSIVHCRAWQPNPRVSTAVVYLYHPHGLNKHFTLYCALSITSRLKASRQCRCASNCFYFQAQLLYHFQNGRR